MALVRRLRSFAWIKARRLPGVRCSTLNTECRSLLCLITIPGRSCVAGIAIAKTLLKIAVAGWRKAGRPHFPPHTGAETVILHGLGVLGKYTHTCYLAWHAAPNCCSYPFVPPRESSGHRIQARRILHAWAKPDKISAWQEL